MDILMLSQKYKEAKRAAMCEANSNAVLADVRAIYDELLEDAMYLYQYYPNNFRKTADEYFKKEIEMQKKLASISAN